jgi:hypothetical protein
MTDLEKVLAKAQYTALPLPREKSAPTTVYSFHEGQLFVVRNPHTCLPDPPLTVSEDRAVDTLQFQREFGFNLKGIVSFVVKIFSLGQAKGEFEAKNVSSATVVMGGLQHETIQTGDLIDFLLAAQRNSCLRDILDKNNFTVVAALKASTFTYTFKNSKGATIDLSLPEAEGLFKTDASVAVSVTNGGKVVVNAPRYVGVVSWKGDTIATQLEKARRFAAGGPALVGYEAPGPFAFAASLADIENVRAATLPSRPAKKKAKVAPKKKGQPARKVRAKARAARNR